MNVISLKNDCIFYKIYEKLLEEEKLSFATFQEKSQ